LLIKQRLFSENWAYVIDNIDKTSKEKFLSGNFISVKSIQAIDRVENLCEFRFTYKDKQILTELRKRRNKIEHFNIEETTESLQSIVLMALSFAIRFISNNLSHLKLNINDNKILVEIKKASMEIKELEDSRINLIIKQAINDEIKLDTLLTCPKCLKKFYRFEDGHNGCLFCYHHSSAEELAHSYLLNEMGLSIENSDEWPQYECIYCGTESMVQMHDKNYYCFSCREHINKDKVAFCVSCGTTYSNKEDAGFKLCPSCFEELYLNGGFTDIPKMID